MVEIVTSEGNACAPTGKAEDVSAVICVVLAVVDSSPCELSGMAGTGLVAVS